VFSEQAAVDEVLLESTALRDIEKNAKKVAEGLDYMMDNLKYSLHAVSCSCFATTFLCCFAAIMFCCFVAINCHPSVLFCIML